MSKSTVRSQLGSVAERVAVFEPDSSDEFHVLLTDDLGKRLARAEARRMRPGSKAKNSTANSIDRARGLLSDCWGPALIAMLLPAKTFDDRQTWTEIPTVESLWVSDYEIFRALAEEGYRSLHVEDDVDLPGSPTAASTLSFLCDLQKIASRSKVMD